MSTDNEHRVMEYNYKNGGIIQKYAVKKANGDPVDDDAIYFVLRVDKDPHARKALRAYAESVLIDNEELASDLILLVERFEN